jgi:hypothetical protein
VIEATEGFQAMTGAYASSPLSASTIVYDRPQARDIDDGGEDNTRLPSSTTDQPNLNATSTFSLDLPHSQKRKSSIYDHAIDRQHPKAFTHMATSLCLGQLLPLFKSNR